MKTANAIEMTEQASGSFAYPARLAQREADEALAVLTWRRMPSCANCSAIAGSKASPRRRRSRGYTGHRDRSSTSRFAIFRPNDRYTLIGISVVGRLIILRPQ